MDQEVGGSSPLTHPIEEAVFARLTPESQRGILGFFGGLLGVDYCNTTARGLILADFPHNVISLAESR